MKSRSWTFRALSGFVATMLLAAPLPVVVVAMTRPLLKTFRQVVRMMVLNCHCGCVLIRSAKRLMLSRPITLAIRTKSN